METLKGLKHQAIPPFTDFGLIFWVDEELSQQLFFDSEEEANDTLIEIIEGKGLNVSYPSSQEVKRIYPHRVIKIKFLSEYHLLEDFIRVENKNDIALSTEQPKLEEQNNEHT